MDLRINPKTFTEKMEAFGIMLKGLRKSDLSVAVIGKDSENWAAAVIAAADCCAEIIPLEEELEPHIYRRILSESGCECLLYSESFRNLAYSIYNSGTTMIQDFICIDDPDFHF